MKRNWITKHKTKSKLVRNQRADEQLNSQSFASSQQSARLILPAWLSWWFADLSSRLRENLIIFDGNWGVHISLFPMKEEIVEWLNQKSRVRKFWVVHSQMLSHFLHHLHLSKLVLCHGYLCYMMIVENPAHHLHHLPDFNWESICARKSPKNCYSHLVLY